MKIYGVRCSWYQFKYDKFGAQWIPIIYKHVCDALNDSYIQKEPNDIYEMIGEWYQGLLFGAYYKNIDRISIDAEIAERKHNEGIFDVYLFHKRLKVLDRGYYKAQNKKNFSMTYYTRFRSMKIKLGLRRVVNFKGTNKGEI